MLWILLIVFIASAAIDLQYRYTSRQVEQEFRHSFDAYQLQMIEIYNQSLQRNYLIAHLMHGLQLENKLQLLKFKALFSQMQRIQKLTGSFYYLDSDGEVVGWKESSSGYVLVNELPQLLQQKLDKAGFKNLSKLEFFGPGFIGIQTQVLNHQDKFAGWLLNTYSARQVGQLTPLTGSQLTRTHSAVLAPSGYLYKGHNHLVNLHHVLATLTKTVDVRLQAKRLNELTNKQYARIITAQGVLLVNPMYVADDTFSAVMLINRKMIFGVIHNWIVAVALGAGALLVLGLLVISLLGVQYKRRQQLALSSALLEAAFARKIFLAILDSKGRVKRVNGFFLETFGLRFSDMQYKPLDQIIDFDPALPKLLDMAAKRGHWRGEMKLGLMAKLVYVQFDISLVKQDNLPALFVCSGIDNQAQREMTKLLTAQATMDSLTGLYNRTFLNDQMEREIKRSERNESPPSLLLIDIDYFKQINDQYGHLVGDQVLVEFAQLLLTRVRASDILVRWGGEEFVILAPDTLLKDACQLADQLLVSISEHTFTQQIHCSCSIGIAQWNSGLSAQQVFQQADEALYEAKASGRNAYWVWEKSEDDKNTPTS
ncbi:GGDEF domain-containing protein [Celerinatantimonas diazotrophica]|uniref:GGDEF domain-containing protein n=1 Tax=Celerinatantimonas diazotrophica TaxID=412034 RepID=UPI001404D07F|nr:GGDEF domain-containing protein [Celerinatantimonas diazotrophica]